MKSQLIILLFFVFCLGCVEKKQETNIDNVENVSANSGPPANAWQDECGFAFEFGSDNYFYALGNTKIVKLKILNDSTYQINYPKQPVRIKNVKFDNYEGKSWVSYDNSGLTNCIDKKNREILFGPDRLKYKMLAKDVIQINFPKKSIWHFTRISEEEMFISNGNIKLKFTKFMD